MSYSPNFYEGLATFLGGKDVVGVLPRNEEELNDLVKRGVGVGALSHVAKFFELSDERLSALLDIPFGQTLSLRYIKTSKGVYTYKSLTPRKSMGVEPIGGVVFPKNVGGQTNLLNYGKKSPVTKKHKLTPFTDLNQLPKFEDKLEVKESDILLDKRTSEHIIKLAELSSRGTEVFENEEKFKRWLNTPIGAFQGKKPIEYIDTITGIEMILDELGRIEHGIFY